MPFYQLKIGSEFYELQHINPIRLLKLLCPNCFIFGSKQRLFSFLDNISHTLKKNAFLIFIEETRYILGASSKISPIFTTIGMSFET